MKKSSEQELAKSNSPADTPIETTRLQHLVQSANEQGLALSTAGVDDVDRDAPQIEVPEGFHVDSEGKANWVTRKIIETRGHAARVKDWAARELRRSQNQENWLLRRFTPELEHWLREQLRRGGRRRSVGLPDGTIGLRLVSARLDVLDENELAKWCEGHLAEALRITVVADGTVGLELLNWHRLHAIESRLERRVLRDTLGRHFDETGELPDGAVLRHAEDHFYVK